MDAAGQIAADRGIKECVAQELNLKIIILSGAKDPDECLKNSPDSFKEAVKNAKPMLEYYFEKVSAGLDLEKLDNKRAVRDKMFIMIDLVVNKSEQGYWLKKMSEELGFFENDIREEFLKWQGKNSVLKDSRKDKERAPKAPVPMSETSREDKLGELLFSLLVKFPEFINYSTDNFEPDLLTDAVLAGFYKNLIIYYNKSASLDYENFRASLEENGAGQEKLLDKLILLGEKDFYNYEPAQVKAEIANIITELKKYDRQRKAQKLQKAITQAEKEGNDEELAARMEELKNLMIS
jgi:DNA primase